MASFANNFMVVIPNLDAFHEHVNLVSGHSRSSVHACDREHGWSRRQLTHGLAFMQRFVLVLALLASCHDDPPVTYPTTANFDQSKLPLGPADKVNLTVFYGSHSIQASYTLDSSGVMAVQ